MRSNIVHPGADKLRYEIREIVAVAKRVSVAGIPITWENIGDPVAKGEVPPAWIKKIIQEMPNASMAMLGETIFVATNEPKETEMRLKKLCKRTLIAKIAENGAT